MLLHSYNQYYVDVFAEGRNASQGLIPVILDKILWPEMEARESELLPGGEWKPSDCIARDHVAIVLPYRDREEHLRSFLSHMHPFLQRQQLHYAIFVVEQVSS